MKIMLHLVRVWLGSMFLYSAALKLVHYQESRKGVARYAVLPKNVSNVVGIVLPWTEGLAAVSLLFGWWYPIGPLLSVLLGSAFAQVSQIVLERGETVSCGCTGGKDELVSKMTRQRGITIALSGMLLLLGGRQQYTRFSTFLTGTVMVLALMPAGVELKRELVHAQLRQQYREERKQRINQLVEVLARDPGDRESSASEVDLADTEGVSLN